MTYKSYSTYKPVNGGWFNENPSHWGFDNCRAIVDNVNIKNEGALQQNYLSLMAGLGIIPYSEKGDVGNKKPEDLTKCKIVKKGNLVINSMNYSIGSYGMSSHDGVCSPVYIVLNPKEEKVLPRFALRVFENRAFQNFAASFGNGILEHRAAIGWDDIKKIKIGIPPMNEQQKIVAFLDRETTKIDELILKQEKLIELIHEKQKSEILICTTQGIEGAVDLKNSTNIWLDKIPAHWSEGNLKVLSKIYSGGTPDKSKQEYWTDGTVPWLNSGSVNDFYINSPSEYITEEALAKSSAKWIKKGSVLVALAGQGKTKGMAAQLMIDSTCNQSMCAIVPGPKLDGNYLLWWLAGNYQNIRNMAGGDLRDGLNLEMIGSIKCPIPPLKEQLAIANHLHSLREKNITLIKKCKESIELLKEHRASLISAAVTGKIDVRDVA